MKLTNEQKKEILLKYINPETDFIRADNGRILVTVDASQRIAESFNLKIEPNSQFEPMEIANYIIQREQQKMAAAESLARLKAAKEAEEKAKMERIMSCIKDLVSQSKNDFEIAKGLDEQCSDLPFSEIKKGIEKATQDGILSQDNNVKGNFAILKNRESVTNRFISVHKASKNPEKLAEMLSDDLLGYYNKNVLSLGHLHIALRDAGIEEKIIEATLAKFYAKYESTFVERYANSDISVDSLVDEVFVKYLSKDTFNANVITAYIEKLGKENINIEDIAYRLYRKEGDEQRVCKIMLKQNISIEQRVEMLKDLELQYPISCLKRTFDILKDAYELPYDTILNLYMANEKEEDEEVELAAVDGTVSPLDDEEEVFEETDSKNLGGVEAEVVDDELEDEEDLEEEIEFTPRRLKIVKKEKEVKKIERKKTLAIMLMGAGIVPVMLLTWKFRVDPIIAARNCSTALSQLVNGSMGLKDFLPSGEQLVGLLAGMGTTFVGFANFLKNRKKLKEAKEELEELTVEELEPEETSIKRGRR